MTLAKPLVVLAKQAKAFIFIKVVTLARVTLPNFELVSLQNSTNRLHYDREIVSVGEKTRLSHLGR